MDPGRLAGCHLAALAGSHRWGGLSAQPAVPALKVETGGQSPAQPRAGGIHGAFAGRVDSPARSVVVDACRPGNAGYSRSTASPDRFGEEARRRGLAAATDDFCPVSQASSRAIVVHGDMSSV